MKPLAIADDHGSTFRVSTCDDGGHAWIRVTDSHGQIANACVNPAEFPEAALALYEACGLPVPVILERPEMPASGILTELGTVYPYHSRGGLLVGVSGKENDRYLKPGAAREAAAALAACADLEMPGPDPAELSSLMREAGIGEVSARAAIRWMRDREATP